jgi:hypothetical protein
MRRFLRENGLSIVLLASFFLLLVGQSCVGLAEYNDERRERALPPLNYPAYLASSHFWEATTENWESEFFQMSIYVVLTAYLFQRGSSESKNLTGENPQDEDPRKHRRDPDAPWPVRARRLDFAALRIFSQPRVRRLVPGDPRNARLEWLPTLQ